MSIDYDNYIVQHKACVIRAFKWIIQNISTKNLDHIFPNLPSIEDVMIQLNSHDASKFSQKEYNAYDNYFYGEKTDDVKKDFDYAWLNHIHMNPHHWQHWILKEDDSLATDTYMTIKCLEIPDNYILEMICDWWSFSWKNYIKSHNKNDLYEVFNWYDNHRDKIAIHYRSREKVEHILNIIRDILDNNDISHSGFGKRIVRDPLKASEVDNSLFGVKTLSHHGVKGQQWGVRHGPPYPLKQPRTDISDETYAKINELYKTLNSFDYGCIIDGKRYNENNLDEVDWSKYRTMPVKEFEKNQIGTCWDYTNYQHAKLKEANIDHDTHMLVMETDDGPVTHTFTTFKDPVNNKNYWFEQALYSERGIHSIDTYQDAVDVISKRYDSSGKKAFDVYEFNPDGMDNGLSDQEFFDRATANDPVMQRK